MKKICINFFIRIIVTIIIVVFPLIIIEIFHNIASLEHDWVDEDNKIIQMDTAKLQYSEYGDNGLWFHKNEELKPKEEGKKRILIVGDSYVWGHGYSNANHLWWQQLKLMLKQNGYNDVEIIAAGINGYNTKEQLNYILKDKEMIEKVDPDFIICTYVNNDADMTSYNGTILLDHSDFDKHDPILFFTFFEKVFPKTYYKVSNLIADKFFQNKEFEERFGKYYYTWIEEMTTADPFVAYENEIIKPLKEYITNELQIPFMYYMTLFDPTDPGIMQVSKLMDKYNIKNYFWFESAQKYSLNTMFKELKINPANWHPSVELAKAYAECLLKILEDDYPELIGEKSGKYTETFTINDWMPYSLLPEKVDKNTYTITYPNKKAELSFLYLPVEKDYIKLNLEYPIDINKIKIEGENIKNINVWVNTINEELGYDDQVMKDLGIKQKDFVWELNGNEKVTSINISAKIKNGKQQKLKIIVE